MTKAEEYIKDNSFEMPWGEWHVKEGFALEALKIQEKEFEERLKWMRENLENVKICNPVSEVVIGYNKGIYDALEIIDSHINKVKGYGMKYKGNFYTEEEILELLLQKGSEITELRKENNRFLSAWEEKESEITDLKESLKETEDTAIKSTRLYFEATDKISLLEGKLKEAHDWGYDVAYLKLSHKIRAKSESWEQWSQENIVKPIK